MMDFQTSIILSVFGCILFVSTVQCNVWTVDCGTLATQRLDPIVFPGKNPAGHVHSIVGGSQFNESVQYSNLQDSQCTTCNVPDDLSNYWVRKIQGKIDFTRVFLLICMVIEIVICSNSNCNF